MRPVRLDIEGFTAFRDLVTIDFEGADLFALTGPTGAGKSSVVDAMVFALFGCVPRLDRRLVAPIISLGRTEARVRFRFTLGDDAYVAVRVVRRTKHGASTREARLEREVDGAVLAGNERELTAEIERLLGLGFEQFIKCVVLPQGEFMRLLHDEPAKRQDLLVSLLDIGLYEAMARAASRRANLAEEAVTVAERLLEKLAGASPRTRLAAEAEVVALEGLRSELVAVRPRLDELQGAERNARARARHASAQVCLLRSVVPPDGLGDWAAEAAALQVAVERGCAEEEAAEGRVEQAAAALEALPGRVEIEAALELHHQRRRFAAQRDRIAATISSARGAEAAAAAAHSLAEAALAAAVTELERARWDHRAHDLARTLIPGNACPVCHRTIDVLPELGVLPELDLAVAAHGEAEAARRRTNVVLRTAEQDRLDAETRAAALADHAAALEERIDDGSSVADLQAIGVEVASAEAALRAARAADGDARRATAAARTRLQGAIAKEGVHRRRFAEVRDSVAALEPPAAGQEDLVADWTALVDWAAGAAEAAEASAQAAAREAAALQGDATVLGDRVAELCAAAGLGGADGDGFEAVVDHLGRARAKVERIDADMAEADGYRAEIRERSKGAAVARDLARHLSASHFEKWVLDEALGLLVAGATTVLLELSRGDYSLALDERSNFLVIDHRAADEVRSARTLSGGETFLASLALALALADQIGQLAANGAARLESIFLDEGFGALDPDTLDTVAVAIEELGARGRTVGLITHLPELAERVPVRFDVVKASSTSTVVRVEA